MISTYRTVLNNLRELSNNSDDILVFLGCTTCICRYDDDEKTYDYSKYESEISSIIQQLVDDGFLKYQGNEYHFSLTQRGLHPHLFKWEDLKTFLFRSLFVPILVAFITAVITASVPVSFQQLLQWLKLLFQK